MAVERIVEWQVSECGGRDWKGTQRTATDWIGLERIGFKFMSKKTIEASGPVTNGAVETIELGQPYIMSVTIEGSVDLIFHRWNCEAVEEKSNAKKGSAAKKSDNIESYVYRNEDNVICFPSEYLRMPIIHAAKFRQDPRSPRKSAMDLFKAAIVGMEPLCPVFVDGRPTTSWEYEHKCRVVVQRSGITRTRPAFRKGWRVTVPLMVTLPEYVSKSDLLDVINSAGRIIGTGDFRPTYGRFAVVNYEQLV